MKIFWRTCPGMKLTPEWLSLQGIGCGKLDEEIWREVQENPRAILRACDPTYNNMDVVEVGGTYRLSPHTFENHASAFSQEHKHIQDEIRLILDGYAVFDIRSEHNLWIRAIVEKQEFICIPAGTWHRFETNKYSSTKAIRLFQTEAGWVPEYRYTEASTL